MAKLYGQLERAQIENLAADPTGVDLVEGRIWFRTDLDVFRAVANSVVVEFADLATAQTFSNKTLANPSVEGYIDIDQIATPANPGSGILRIYQKADGKLYTLDENGNELPLGSGSGSGGINYIPEDSRDIESTVGQWLTDDGAGSASGLLTLSTTSVVGEVLRSGSSLKLAKSGADANGHFIKVATLDIDPADYETSSALYYSSDCKPLAGYVADDLTLEFYDVTNAVVLYSQGVKDIPNSQVRLTAVTFLAATTVTVEVRLKVNNTNTNAYDVVLDGFVFGPDKIIDSPVVSDWVSFTPVIQSTAGSVSLATTKEVFYGQYRRVGNTMNLQIAYKHTNNAGANAGGAAAYNWAIPGGLTLDTTALVGNRGTVGHGFVFGTDDGTGVISVRPDISANGLFMYAGGTGGATLKNNIRDTAWETTQAQVEYYIEATIPIVEWANSSAVLSTTEMLNTASKAKFWRNGDATTLTTAETDIIWNAESYNDGSGISANLSNGEITVNKSGKFRIYCQYQLESYNADERAFGRIRVNGNEAVTSIMSYKETFVYVQMTTTLDLSVGDVITVSNQSVADSNYVFNGLESVTYITLEEIVDLSVYSVYGQTEYKSVENASSFFSTTGNAWESVTGMTLTLTPGEWDIGYDCSIGIDYVSGASSSARGNVCIYDITNSSRFDSTIGISYPKGQLTSGNDSGVTSISRSTRVVVTEGITVQVQLRGGSTIPGAVQVNLKATSVTGAFTDPDNASVLWARRVK